MRASEGLVQYRFLALLPRMQGGAVAETSVGSGANYIQGWGACLYV